ncbi:MAG TPA: hypothetical protein HPQ04_08490 [Rhodospirillaceae bacterium]|nr:hypothetical protein [Rhodospirillaceae bacterium]
MTLRPQALRLADGWQLAFSRFTSAQLFALVSDIEHYPDFVPGCIAARIVERADGRWRVDNLFGIGPIRRRFFTLAEFDGPWRLDITSTGVGSGGFRIDWRFRDVDDGCLLTCRFNADFRSDLVAAVAGFLRTDAEKLIIDAFQRRAYCLFGAAAAP